MRYEYRIKKIEYNGGLTKHFPQYRHLIFWYYFSRGTIKYSQRIFFYNIKDAENYIEKDKILEANKSIKKISFIK